MATVSNRGTKDRPMWYCRYIDTDGKRKQRPTKQTTKAAALRFVAEIEARVARGQMGIPEVSKEEQTAKALTVGDLAERFLNEYDAPRLKDREQYMSNVRPWVRVRLLPYPLALLPVVEVKKLHVVQYRDTLRKQGFQPSTINTWLHFLSRVFTWGADSEIIDTRNPCSKIERLRMSPSEQRYSLEECGRLLGPDCDPQVAVALMTGCRLGELFGLRWRYVRFDLGCIEIRHSYRGTPKSGKARTIPLHSDLAPILRGWQKRCPETPEGLVFPVAGGDKYRMGRRQDGCRVRRILQAAGVPADHDHPWHAMRHTFATLALEAGASFDAISRILGHSGGGSAVTRGYTHVSVEYLAREIEKLRLVPGQPADVLNLADFRKRA